MNNTSFKKVNLKYAGIFLLGSLFQYKKSRFLAFNKDGLKIDRDLVLSLIDLTSLNNTDNNEVIAQLVKNSVFFGPVAALCIYPKFVSTVDKNLKLYNANMPIATVVNFPTGGEEIEKIKSDIIQSIENGAKEIDIVIPYKDCNKGDFKSTEELVKLAKKLCGENVSLKVIIESGYYTDEKIIRGASRAAIYSGADFIKTSTGKISIGATPEAAEAMLSEIKRYKDQTGKWVGFKASGGIRTYQQALIYVNLARSICGEEYLNNRYLRLGASSLLDDLYKL
jgi:deoxyribose-phosphate aldolase